MAPGTGGVYDGLELASDPTATAQGLCLETVIPTPGCAWRGCCGGLSRPLCGSIGSGDGVDKLDMESLDGS